MEYDRLLARGLVWDRYGVLVVTPRTGGKRDTPSGIGIQRGIVLVAMPRFHGGIVERDATLCVIVLNSWVVFGSQGVPKSSMSSRI